MRRGEVWLANLGKPRGSEPGYRRPVVIVQSDDFNRSQLRTVVAAAITSNLSLALAPGNVACRPKVSGLPRTSVINVSQLATVDRGDLVARVGQLPEPVMQQVDEGLRLVLTLH
jgi:mRNA interferase MazF